MDSTIHYETHNINVGELVHDLMEISQKHSLNIELSNDCIDDEFQGCLKNVSLLHNHYRQKLQITAKFNN